MREWNVLTEEEKQARRKGIGGSDVSSVLGLKPYGCALRLWFDKTGAKQDFEEMNPNMERGIYLEDIVCELYKIQSGNLVNKVGQRHHDELSFMLANVDRMITPKGESDKVGVLEVKCPNKESFLRMKTDGIPEAYILQGQHYMYVTNTTWMEYAVFCADMWMLEIIPIERDDSLVELILTAGKHFWKLVQSKEQPDRLEYGDSRCKKCNWRLHCWKAEWEENDFDYESKEDEYEQVDGDEFHDTFEEHKENVAIAKQADELVEESKKRLMGIVGEKKKVRCDNGKICFRWEKKSYINMKKLELDHPDLVKKYRYDSGSKPFRFYPKKGK